MLTFKTKVCYCCNINKQLADFSKKSNTSDGYATTCKECAKEKRRLSRTKTKQEKANEYAYKRRLERKLWAVNYLGNKCSKCGITYPHYVYDFHHKNPKEKEFAISLILYYSEESLKKELDKCALLCANCHREEHWGAI